MLYKIFRIYILQLALPKRWSKSGPSDFNGVSPVNVPHSKVSLVVICYSFCRMLLLFFQDVVIVIGSITRKLHTVFASYEEEKISAQPKLSDSMSEF